MTLTDQIALVTGASRGIGQAIALRLAAEGAMVVATARNTDRIHSWAAEAGEPGKRVVPMALDVTDGSACEKLIDDVTTRHGRLDVLVNNAGVTKDGLFMSMSDEDFDFVLQTNLHGAFRLMRGAVRHMVRARRGRIVNISSVTGVMGNAGQANYAASKAGLIGLSKSLAKEVGKRGVTCNVIAPGFIETDMTEVLPDKLKEEVKKIIPLQRMGKAEEVAGLAAFLSGPDSSYITGQVFLVDGGLHM